MILDETYILAYLFSISDSLLNLNFILKSKGVSTASNLISKASIVNGLRYNYYFEIM
jgi:hypothetical protein